MRKLLKVVIYACAAVAVVLLAVGFLVLEDSPVVVQEGPPTPEDVAEAREFVRGVRAAINPGQTTAATFVTSEAQLNRVIKLGARLVPGFRGHLQTAGENLHGTVSIPVPHTQRWINLRASVPEFEGALTLSDVSVGPLSVPPVIALGAARHVGNIVVGEGFGDTVLSAASRLEIEGEDMIFDLAMDEMGSNGLMRGIFGTLRGSEMPQASDIDRYYLQIRTAMDAGDLPADGSYLPYLGFTLEAALAGSETEGIANAYTSAITALALVCGAGDFTLIVGGMVGSEFIGGRDWKADCGALTLNDRIDSRRHFTTAAAIQAASNRGFAVSVGEFKELYDTVKSGGFDFTDIAASNSGIRMSNTMMSAPAADWPALIARFEEEGDVIVSFDGIPQIMSGEEFKRLHEDMDSPAYKAMIAKIETKIDALALHRR